ncbi:MAG: GYDIA family GHMP kinase [Saprospiraceae bacterium]
MTTTFYAHGKLLLTGEYVVLDGVAALAVPTRPGQRMTVETAGRAEIIHWTSLDERGECWYEGRFILTPATVKTTADDRVSERLAQLLTAVLKLRPDAGKDLGGKRVTTRLEFDRRWGLGSSSTLVAMLAEWMRVDPYELLAASFGGSGYDIACAKAGGPIRYHRHEAVRTEKVAQLPDHFRQTCFVYSGQKQDSRAGIAHYRERPRSEDLLNRIGELTTTLLTADRQQLMIIVEEHERLLSKYLGLERAQDRYFADFPGQIKSLGAWGGDFYWAVPPPGQEVVKTTAYFNERGYGTVLPWNEMLLSWPTGTPPA